jgi:tetratricopeptide (TPR) repeat protein
MRAHLAWAVAGLPLAACTVPVREPAPPAPTHASSNELAAAIAADASKAEHEADPKLRAQFVAAASRDAAACIAQAPESAACLYGRGVALGLEAREHPARASAILNDMLAALARAEAIDASYDNAGPARVQALVWIRAPGWPLGPGDPERGLAAAQRATALRPQHPPNWLALAEAQSKAGNSADARASYLRARDLAQTLPDTTDRAEWLKQAQQGLSHLS